MPAEFKCPFCSHAFNLSAIPVADTDTEPKDVEGDGSDDDIAQAAEDNFSPPEPAESGGNNEPPQPKAGRSGVVNPREKAYPMESTAVCVDCGELYESVQGNCPACGSTQWELLLEEEGGKDKDEPQDAPVGDSELIPDEKADEAPEAPEIEPEAPPAPESRVWGGTLAVAADKLHEFLKRAVGSGASFDGFLKVLTDRGIFSGSDELATINVTSLINFMHEEDSVYQINAPDLDAAIAANF